MIADPGPWTIGAAAALLVLALRAWALSRSSRERERLAEHAVLSQMVRVPGEGQLWLRSLLVALGVGALAAAAAGAGTREAERPPEGGNETVLVLDASNSMLARDVEPSRLEAQRQVARSLASRLPGKVAVVYFAGRGYVLSPLTTDINAVQMFVDAVRPASVGRGGSSLAAGLTQAMDLLAGGEEDARSAIVVLSDGEETVGQPTEETIERAVQSGVAIHTIGIGTAEGASIPLSRDAALDPGATFNRRRGEQFLRGPDGEIVITKLEENALRTIAGETGGHYMLGTSSNIGQLVADLGAPTSPASEAGGGIVGLLLLLGFGLLWGEAFAFSRG